MCLGLSFNRKIVEHVWIISNVDKTKNLDKLIVYNTCDSLSKYNKYEVDSGIYNKELKKINVKEMKSVKHFEKQIKKEKRKLVNLNKKEKQKERNKEKIEKEKEEVLIELGRLESLRIIELSHEIDIDKYKGITKEPKKLDKEQFTLNNYL